MEANPQDVFDLVAGLKEAYASGGWLLLAAVVLKSGVEVLSKWEWLQKFLPEKYQWANLGTWTKRSLIVGVSFVCAALTAMAGGLSWSAALIAAIPTALAALGIHHKAGKAETVLDKHAEQDQTVGTGKDPTAKPSIYRAILDKAADPTMRRVMDRLGLISYRPKDPQP